MVALRELEFEKAFSLLDDKNEVHACLKRYLQQVYVPRFIKHTYDRIDMPTLLKMMGLKAEAELKKALIRHQVEGTKFVTLTEVNMEASFKLDANRVAGLAQMAQYLEKY